MDIVALGTVADCMPLTDENRAIVWMGLRQIYRSRSIGIGRIIAEKKIYKLDADIFSFLLGPRLNAAGRIHTPHKAVQLLVDNSHNIDQILADIEEMNDQRKAYSATFLEDALEQVDTTQNVLFYDHTEIPHGIIGLVA